MLRLRARLRVAGQQLHHCFYAAPIVEVTGRKSQTSLYRPDIASFTMGAGYNQKDAEGFIRILGLPARSRALVHSETVK